MRARGRPTAGSSRSQASNTRPIGHWLSIKVELTGGRGDEFDRPAGRLFVASSKHTFRELAAEINTAFARWDVNHLHEFELADGTRIGPIDEDADEEVVDDTGVKLSRLKEGEVFGFTFDFGDMWVHRCTVDGAAVNPSELLGHAPEKPTAYFGWGSIPDQYGRNSPDDMDD